MPSITYFPERELPARTNLRIFDFGSKGRVELMPGSTDVSDEALMMLATDQDFQTLVKNQVIVLPEGVQLMEQEQAQKQLDALDETVAYVSASTEEIHASPLNAPVEVQEVAGETREVTPEAEKEGITSSPTNPETATTPPTENQATMVDVSAYEEEEEEGI